MILEIGSVVVKLKLVVTNEFACKEEHLKISKFAPRPLRLSKLIRMLRYNCNDKQVPVDCSYHRSLETESRRLAALCCRKAGEEEG